MPRCGCGDTCACHILVAPASAGDLTITGDGTEDNPYRIALTSAPSGGSGSEVPNLKEDYGAAGDNTANDTGALEAAIDDLPAGSPLWVPHGRYLIDPVVSNKMLAIQGPGRHSAQFRSRVSHGGPLIDFDLPAPSGSLIFSYHGTRLEGVGIDLADGGSSASGLRLGENTHWATVSDVAVFGPSGAHTGIGIANYGLNSIIERSAVYDCGRMIVVDGDTGLDLTLRDIVLGRNAAGTTTMGIDVACDDAAATHGALMMENVRLSTATGGGISSTGGMKVTAPSLLSVPVFARGVILDNITGVGLQLDNIRDFAYADGWINSAAGGPCVRITGGENLRFSGNDYRGGGSPPKTYDFVGGTTNGFVSVGNYCPTSTVYHLPSTGKPTKLHLDDLIFTDTPIDVSNDMAGLRAAQAPRLGTPWFGDESRFGAVGQAVSYMRRGTVTLSGSPASATVADTSIDADTMIVVPHRANPVGTPGHLTVTITTGVGFTINSTTAETSPVDYFVFRRT